MDLVEHCFYQRSPNLSAVYLNGMRDFTWQERLWSEAVALLEYARQILIPNVLMMGPMQDGPTRIHGPDLYSITAALSLLLALFISFRSRHRYPILFFGICFFLAGHLIESTFIQLEIYFEHRNYIPSIGLLSIPIALAWLSNNKKISYATIIAIPLLATLLLTTTAGWGNALAAAERWHNAHPESPKAIHHRADIVDRYVSSTAAAALLVDLQNNHDGDNPALTTMALSYLCKANNGDEGISLFKKTVALFNNPIKIKDVTGVMTYINNMSTYRMQGSCTWLSADQFIKLLLKLSNNPTIALLPSQLSRIQSIIGLAYLEKSEIMLALDAFKRS